MSALLHLIAYLVSPLLLWLVPSLFPFTFRAIPFAFCACYNVVVTNMFPLPNGDDFFALYNYTAWSIACCLLTIHGGFLQRLAIIPFTDYCEACGLELNTFFAPINMIPLTTFCDSHPSLIPPVIGNDLSTGGGVSE